MKLDFRRRVSHSFGNKFLETAKPVSSDAEDHGMGGVPKVPKVPKVPSLRKISGLSMIAKGK